MKRIRGRRRHNLAGIQRIHHLVQAPFVSKQRDREALQNHITRRQQQVSVV